MDWKLRLRAFLGQHQTVGWLLVAMGGGLVLQGLLYLILSSQAGLYESVIKMLVLPYHIKGLFPAVWSIFSYPFFHIEFNFLHILVSGLILWTFGRIHQQLLGEDRTRRLVILGIPVIGILTVLISTLFAFQSPADAIVSARSSAESEIVAADPSTVAEEDAVNLELPEEELVKKSEPKGITVGLPGLLHGSGLMAIIMLLVISCVTLVPDYPIQLFLFGQVKIVWVGIALFALELLWANFFTPQGISIMIGGLLGFLHIYALKNGSDLTEIAWSFYRSNPSKPKMTVKYGSQRPAERNQQGKRLRVEAKDKISQEIIDGILDKISEQGYDSLSREEKELLFKASSEKEDENAN